MEQYFEIDSKSKAISSAKDMYQAHKKEVLVIEKSQSDKKYYILVIDPDEYFNNYMGEKKIILELKLQHIFNEYKMIYRCK